jgi:anti-sigma regulatory factor (Ser/Thr protein kinase)
METPANDAAADQREITLGRDMGELARLGRWLDEIAGAAGWSDSTLFAVRLCLEESVTNVIRHGVVADGHQEIRVSEARRDGRLSVCVEDHGAAFDPTECPPPEHATSIADAKIGGLGIHLMRQFATQIDYRRVGPINRLVFFFDGP